MTILLAAEEATGLAALGLSLPALIFQLINFGILYFVLNKYAFPPIIRLLDSRRKTIAQGIEDADAAKAAKEQAETERQRVIEGARNDASDLVEAARSEAKREADRIVKEAHAAADATVSGAEQRIERERREARAELMQELGGVVAAATAAVTRDEVTPKADAAVIRKALQEASR